MGQCQVVNRHSLVIGRERRFHREQKRLDRRREESAKCEMVSSCRPGWSGNIRVGALVSPQNRHFSSEYELLCTSLGKGMSGDVRLARAKHSDTFGLVAVKTLDKTGLTKKELRSLLTEVDIYLQMDHENIARLVQVFDEPDVVYLVMEYCSGGTLLEKLQKQGRFNEEQAAVAIHQVLTAVSYCHSRPAGKVIHRDLKLANFVYDSDEHSVLKLVDFGLSRVLTPSCPLLTRAAGTLEYIAPEALKGEPHCEACDLWSVGVMAYALLSGRLPFDGGDNDEIEKAIVRGEFDMNGGEWVGVSESAKDFVRTLLTFEPARRPNVEEALRSTWMSSVAQPADSAAQAPIAVEVLRRVEKFASEHAMRRAAAAMAVYSQTELEGEDVELAEQQFRRLDIDGNGAIDRRELTKVLQDELGILPERSAWVFDQLDLDGDQEIQRTEFLAAVIGARLLCSRAKIHKAFDCFDLDRSGKIQSGELACVLGAKFCGKATSRIFSELDTNGDKQIDFEEFSCMVDSSTRTSI